MEAGEVLAAEIAHAAGHQRQRIAQASMAVVLVLGARPSAQASCSGPSSMVDRGGAAQRAGARRGDGDRCCTPKSASDGSSRTTSSVSPLCENISTHVVAMNAAQVAVHRFGRVQKVAAGAGRGQRGGDLLCDQPGLAHAAW